MKKLVIDINNRHELKMFYRKLRFYRMFFNKRELEVNIKGINGKDKEELLMCIEAFNIKNRNDRLEYIYDTLCNYHDKLYIDVNICEFDQDGFCLAQRNKKTRVKINGCCGTCTYMGKNGCSIKSIACKSFFCSYIKKKKLIPSYRKIKLYKYFLTPMQKNVVSVNYWTPKEENLKLMKKNSFIYMFFYKERKMKRW